MRAVGQAAGGMQQAPGGRLTPNIILYLGSGHALAGARPQRRRLAAQRAALCRIQARVETWGRVLTGRACMGPWRGVGAAGARLIWAPREAARARARALLRGRARTLRCCRTAPGRLFRARHAGLAGGTGRLGAAPWARLEELGMAARRFAAVLKCTRSGSAAGAECVPAEVAGRPAHIRSLQPC